MDCVFRRYSSSCFYGKQRSGDSVLLRLLVEHAQGDPIDVLSPFLRTPAEARDRIFEPGTAGAVCRS
jgi:hypothetical protein